MKVWQVSNWEPWLGGHTGYSDPVAKVRVLEDGVAVSVSNKYIETRGNPKLGVALRYWNLDPLREGPEILLKGCDTPPRGVGISDDGRFAVCSGGPNIFVYELPALRRKATLTPLLQEKAPDLPVPNSANQCLFVCGSDRIVACMKKEPTVQCFDVKTGKLLKSADPGGHPAVLLDATADGKMIAAVGKDGRLRLLNSELEGMKELGKSLGVALAWAPDGKYLAATSDGVSVDVFDAARGERVKRVEGFGVLRGG